MYPYHAHIEPTTICNLKCVSCSNQSVPESRKGHLTLLELKELVEKNPFIQDVSLLGLGEPLLNPEIVEMAIYLHNRGIQSRIATNGMNLNSVDLEKLLPSIDELIISFDSNEQNSFEEIRKGADFKKIVKNIKEIVNIKKSKRLSLTVSLQTIISKMNIDRLDQIPPLAGELGIDKMRFSPAVQYNPEYNGKKNNGNYKEVRNRIKSIQGPNKKFANLMRNKLESLCYRHNLAFGFAGFSPRFKDCWWPGKGIFITYDGYVTPCCMRMDPALLNFGNLFHQSFESIMEGDEYRRFINSYKKNSCPEICRECPN